MFNEQSFIPHQFISSNLKKCTRHLIQKRLQNLGTKTYLFYCGNVELFSVGGWVPYTKISLIYSQFFPPLTYTTL